jgi:hypothetical protein
MKALLMAAAVLAAAGGAASGQTYVSNDITSSESWSAACSPYIIQADIEITGNSTLSIEAGVTVAFDGVYMLEASWGSAITAMGTPGDRVLFTSNEGAPAPGDWKWVDVSGPNPSVFAYCTFEFAENGLRADFAGPTVSHCTIRSCLSSGLFCGSGSPTVEYCDIYANRDGIGLSGSTVSPNPVINYSNIYDNTHWNIYTFGTPEESVTIDAESNWWGTNIESEIANEIYDSADNPAIHVTVDYTPWWTEQPIELATWTTITALFER